jgi:phenylacetate-CoA ligase
VAEYQVSISKAGALSEVTVRIELQADCKDSTEVAERLQKTFEKSLSLRVPVQLVPAGSLPRFEMKAKRWLRE